MSLIRTGSTFSGLAARIVDVNLITQIPVDPERACEEFRIHHPFTLVAIAVGLAELHRLGEDGPIGE
jgi:hypothetical protein